MTIYYVRPDGDNGNTGLTDDAAGAWRDPEGLKSFYAALMGSDAHTIEFRKADYDGAPYLRANAGYTGHLTVNAEAGTTFNHDPDATDESSALGGVTTGAGAITYNFTGVKVNWVAGAGNSNNGIAGDGTGTGLIKVIGAHIDGAADGITAHASGPLETEDVKVTNSTKYTVSAVGTSDVKIKGGDLIASDSIDPTGFIHAVCKNFTMENVRAHPGTTQARREINIDCTGTVSITGSTLGSHDRPVELRSLMGDTASNVTDTYIHTYRRDGHQLAGTTFTRCFGPIGFAMRGTGTEDPVTFDYCNITLGSGMTDGAFIEDRQGGNHVPGFEGLPVAITNTILTGFSGTCIGNNFTAEQIANWNANSSADYTAFFGNGTNFNVSLTTITNSHTADPELPSAVSQDVAGWRVKATSPILTAGSGGGEIGLNNGTNWAASVAGY